LRNKIERRKSDIEPPTDETIALEGALRHLRIPSTDFLEVQPFEAREVVAQAMATFVEGNPSSWWLSLKGDAKLVEFPEGDAHLHLGEAIPSHEGRAWFIPEVSATDLPVFDVELSRLPDILSECPYFVYNIVGKRFDWLVTENDHNELITVTASRTAA
jgi:hypothetical protein